MRSIITFLIYNLLILNLINAQTTAPDHYWDFSKVTNFNGNDYVFDQVTKDFKYAFGKIPDREGTCDGLPSTTPSYGPEGVFMKSYTDYMRLENANNVVMTNKFMIALWVKIQPIYSKSISNYDILSQRRFDNNVSTPLYSLGIDFNGITTSAEAQFSFYTTLTQFSSPYQQIYVSYQNNKNTSLSEGWYLFSIAVDTSSQNLNLTMRIRGSQGRFDNFNAVQNSGYVYNESAMTTQKTDLYVGGFCNPYFKNQSGGAYPLTVGRLFIWKGFSNLMNHEFFDRFFFRQSGKLTANSQNIIMPTCLGALPCKFCVVGYPLPPTFNTQLACSSDNADQTKYLYADWQFDDPSNTQTSQFVLDQSGNKRHLFKSDPSQVGSNELFRVIGQGSMLYGGIGTIIATGTQLFPFYNDGQFTVELWFRKIIDTAPPIPNNQYNIVPIWITNPAKTIGYFTWSLQEDLQKSNVCYENKCSKWLNSSTIDPQFLKNNTWQFASLAVSNYRLESQSYYMHIRHQIGSYVFESGQQSNQVPFQVPQDAIFNIAALKTVIIRSMQIFTFRKDREEQKQAVSYNCVPIIGQGQCAICPLNDRSYYDSTFFYTNDGQCLTTCKENEFGDNCTKCHPFCGSCSGPTKDDCVYCARNVTPSNAYFSQTNGNCTCISGMYYNSTTDKCELCDSRCKRCFGGSNTECLTCNTGTVFYPQTTCANNCTQLSLLINNNISYYLTNETQNGVFQYTCTECHQYCQKCFGPLNSDCTTCQTGYYLQGNSTCYATCPAGQYPQNLTKLCQNCHTDCSTCSGPLNTNCLTCKASNKVQQDGSCQNTCNNGYYADSSKKCIACNPACASCFSQPSTDCSACSSGYFLEWLGKSCKDTCVKGTYGDTLSNSCQLCHYSCESCSGGNTDQCTKCATGFLRRGAFCVKQCADGEYEVNGACVSCDSKCTTCYGTRNDQCYTCAENIITGIGYFYFNDSCLTTCPVGYYPDNLRRICRKCNPRCASCISDSYCTSCIYGPYQLNNGECTFFTCLDSQYRTIKPQLACYSCDQSCLTCQGQSRFDCLTCKPQNQFQAQQCLSCSQQPGMTDPIDDTPGCVEICGDGFNYGQYQCDDGNLISGDGCSSKCIIEDGFNCTKGSKLAPSVCMDNKNPTPKISLVTSKNQIIIQFDEEVQLQTMLDEKSVKISVSGPQGSYKFDWRLGDEYKTSEPLQIAIFELSFYSSLKGDSKEQVTLQFLSDSVYKDATGNGIITVPLTAYLNKYEYIDPETKAKLDAAGDTSMFATFGAVAINLVISQLFGGSIAAMWTMVNTIQLLSLLPLCNVNYPKILVMVLEKMLSSHGESTIIPNVFYMFIIGRSGSTVKIEPPLNDRFYDYNYTVSNFLYLSGRKILLWTLIIFAYPFVWYMKQKYADKHKLCRAWVQAEQKFRYTMLLRGVIMSYVSMYLAFILGIFQMDLTTMENTISAFFAIAFGIILTYLPILLMSILQRNYERIYTEKFMIAYSTVVKEVDLSHPIRYMYYPVFLMRRALFAISLVLFANNPVQQIGFMSATAFVMVVYVVVIKPQKEKVMIILTALGEGLLVFLHLFSIVFLDENLPEEKANSYGWFMLCIIGLYILSNWVVIAVITVKQLKQKWRDFKQKKVDMKNKVEEDREYRLWKKKRQIRRRMEKDNDKQQMIDIIEEEQQKLEMRKAQSQLNIMQKSNFLQLPYFQQQGPNPYGTLPALNLQDNKTYNSAITIDQNSNNQSNNDSNEFRMDKSPYFRGNEPQNDFNNQPMSPNMFSNTNSKFLFEQIMQQELQKTSPIKSQSNKGIQKYSNAFDDSNRFKAIDLIDQKRDN